MGGGGGETPKETWDDSETAVQNVIKNALMHHYQCRDWSRAQSQFVHHRKLQNYVDKELILKNA